MEGFSNKSKRSIRKLSFIDPLEDDDFNQIYLTDYFNKVVKNIVLQLIVLIMNTRIQKIELFTVLLITFCDPVF